MFDAQIQAVSLPKRMVLLCALLLMMCLAGPARLDTADGIPMTLQSLVVVLMPILVGWRRGVLLVCAYLLLGGIGAPVFAGGTSGWNRFAGTTGGFLLAFPIAATAVGALAERIRKYHALFGGLLMVSGQAIVLTLGLIWSMRISPPALSLPELVAAFLPGLLLKSGIGAMLIALTTRILRSAGQLHPELHDS